MCGQLVEANGDWDRNTEQSKRRANTEAEWNTKEVLLITQLQQSLEWWCFWVTVVHHQGEKKKNKLPRVVHNILHYLVQNFLEESCPDPDVFDGLGRKGLRGAAGGGGALSPQRFMAHALGSPAGHKAQYYQWLLLQRGGHVCLCSLVDIRLLSLILKWMLKVQFVRNGHLSILYSKEIGARISPE